MPPPSDARVSEEKDDLSTSRSLLVVINQFSGAKRAKARKLIDYLHNDASFLLLPQSLEISLVSPPFYSINIIDFLTWLLFSRAEKPELKQPPGIEEFLSKMPQSAIKLIAKDKKQRNNNKIKSPKKATLDPDQSARATSNNNNEAHWLI